MMPCPPPVAMTLFRAGFEPPLMQGSATAAEADTGGRIRSALGIPVRLATGPVGPHTGTAETTMVDRTPIPQEAARPWRYSSMKRHRRAWKSHRAGILVQSQRGGIRGEAIWARSWDPGPPNRLAPKSFQPWHFLRFVFTMVARTSSKGLSNRAIGTLPALRGVFASATVRTVSKIAKRREKGGRVTRNGG